MPRVVVDTNVFVSGLLKGRTTRAIIVAFINNKFIPVFSQDTLTELAHTLSKPKIACFITEEDSAALISLIKERAVFVAPSQKIDICRDAEDNKILECALTAKARLIVTGDKDLLCLSPFQGIEIVSPSRFLKTLIK